MTIQASLGLYRIRIQNCKNKIEKINVIINLNQMQFPDGLEVRNF